MRRYGGVVLTRPQQEKPVARAAVDALGVGDQKALVQANASLNPFFLFFR